MGNLLARLPSHFFVYFFQAQLYLDLYMPAEALAVLDGPLKELFPTSPFVQSQRGFAYYIDNRTSF